MIFISILSICCTIIAAVILYRELYALNRKIIHFQEEVRKLQQSQCSEVQPQKKKKKRVRIITPNRVF